MSKAPRSGIQSVLLDLDGTLLDTAPDMAVALNRLRTERGLEALQFAQIRPHVSHGAVAMIRLGFPGVAEAQFEELRTRFLALYADKLAVQTRLFPGFETVLPDLERRQLRWGIVTNKSAALTAPLLAQLQLDKRAACIVSGDTLAYRKPHPAPLLHAAELLGSQPGNCVYVGDAERDIQAGRAAGMHTLVARFGYLGEADRPESWQADALLDQPIDLLRWINGVS